MATASTADWAAIRIASSTSIQRAVSSSLTHLASSSSTPLVLHSSPSVTSRTPRQISSTTAQADDVEEGSDDEPLAEQPESSRTAINAKSNSAAIGKLVGIIEIIKRNFADHQRALWKADDEKKKRKLEKHRRKNGKKRQRENDAGRDPSIVNEDANASAIFAADIQKEQTLPYRHLLRIYQYNILDYIERTRSSKAHAVRGSDSSESSDSGTTSSDNIDPEVVGPADPQNIAQVTEETQARKALNAAILSHVVGNGKRPRKKHTPHLFCVLSTTRLPGYEKELLDTGKEFTLQLPPKVARPRRRKRKGAKPAADSNDLVEGSGSASDEDDIIAEQIIQSSHGGAKTAAIDAETLDGAAAAEQDVDALDTLNTLENPNAASATSSITVTPPMTAAPDQITNG